MIATLLLLCFLCHCGICQAADLSITPINSDGEVIVLLGNDLRLTCTSNSTPIFFQWTHNEVLISNAVSSILQLVGVNESDAGTYTCSATFIDLIDLSISVGVIVENGWSSESSTQVIGILPSVSEVDYALHITSQETETVNFTVKTLTSTIAASSVKSGSPVKIPLSILNVVDSNTERDQGIVISTDSRKKISVVVSASGEFSGVTYRVFPPWGYTTDEYIYFAVSVTGMSHFSNILIVAANNNTAMTISPSGSSINIPADLVGNGEGATINPGESVNITLHYLQSLLLLSDDAASDLTGTEVTSNKPIAFFSGHMCANIPRDTIACDSVGEQIPPTVAWGHEFFFSSLNNKLSFVKIIAAESSTSLNMSCTSGDYTIQLSEEGQYESQTIPDGDQYCSITASKLICVVQFGFSFLYNNENSGDPLMVLIPPVQQYVSQSSIPVILQNSANLYMNLLVVTKNFNASDIFMDGIPLDVLTWVPVSSQESSIQGYITKGINFSTGSEHIISTNNNIENRLCGIVYGIVSLIGYGYLGGTNLYPYESEVIPLPTIPPTQTVPFVNPPVDVSVLDGGIATLDCNSDGFPTPTIQWKFNDIEILNGGRYSINEQGVLNISNVGLDDIGIYICNATNSIGYANGSISLKVQVPPTFTISPSNITSIFGSPVSFQCEAHGYPLPTITWNWTDNIAGDIQISNTTVSDYTVSSTITFIDNFSLDDNPVIIKCEAVNDLVEEKVTISTIGVLIVNYPAELTFFDGTEIVNETDLLSLRCDFQGGPLPNVRWFRYTEAEVELVNASRINILNVVIKIEELSTRVLSFLNISGIKGEEAGIYRCVGDNGVPNYIEAVQYNDFNITVQVPPDITPRNGITTLAQTRNGSVTIYFDITAQPPVDPSDIQWYFQFSVEELPNNTKKYMFCSDQHSLTILDVQLSDVGTYRIEAENIVGSNIAEVTLFVYVEAALQSTTGYTIERVTGQSISFNCTADGINRPVITWRKDGQLILSTARLNIDSVNDIQGFRLIPGIKQITSLLTISDLREGDSGSYSCRADNEAEIPVSLNSPFLLKVSVPSIPNPCLSSPCQNGNCQPLGEDYLCICDEDYTGTNCDIEVQIFISPTIEVHPVATTGELYQSTSLTCIASGNPTPHIIWYKDNQIIPNTNSDPSVLLFDELNLDDRGFYYCVAESIINGRRESDVSMEVILNINGVLQYEAVIDLPQDFFETERRKRQNQDQPQQIANLISRINDYLSGGILTSNVSFFVVDILNPETINFSRPLQMIPIVITLVTNEGGSEELLEDVEEEMETLGMQLNINITINDVDRFDGCRSNITGIPSHSGNPNLTISIEWPETNIGELAEVNCPCGNITSQEGSLIATRYCGGDFTNGGQWENPNAAACNFSDLAREICQLAELETEARVQQLDEFTENSENLGSTEVIVSVAVLLTATEEVSGNISLTNDFLNVVDNIINVDVETLQETQESSNTSAMILEAIASVAEEIPVGNTSEPVVIPRSAFAVSVQQVDLDQFMEIGQTFSANLGTFSDLNMSENIDSDDLSFDMGSNQSIASISLPNNFFSATPNVTNNTRITHAVFLTDSLFLRRENNDMEVGSIIISASLVGSNSVEGIDPPLNITFLKNPSINGSDPQCSFWNPMLDDGYGDWSSEGCDMDESYNNSQDVLTCFCNHLTSFSILLDVSPEIEPTEDTPLALVLEAVTYIGLIISIFCLLLTIISYLSSTKLRTSEHGQLLINLCFALMGLYITFIFAVHSRTVIGLCAVSAAVLQYFFLVTFMLMAAEAINLYMKLVVVLGSNIPHYVLKATIISWLTPIFIVLFCFAPNYKNYVSDHFCRAFNVPYYIGMVVPFLIIYIFNWVIFFIIIITLLRKSCKSDLKDVKKKQENISFIRQQLIIVTTLSVLFGLGWGIGLFATQDIHNNKIVRDLFAALFVIVTAFHGLFIFIMHCLRSRDIRSVWKQWFYGATGKNFSDFSSSTVGRIQNYRLNTSRTDSTSDGVTLKQYSGKQTQTSPGGGDSSVFTFDDSNLKKGSDTLKYSTNKSLSSQEDAITLEILGKDKQEKEKEMSKEEGARMVESSFNQITVTLDCDDDKEKQEIEKEITTKYQNLPANTSLDCDDPGIN